MEDGNAVGLRQLRYSFQEDEPWGGLTDETSVMYRLFQQPELRDAAQPEKYNVIKLICLGLMLCGGDADLKARVFYDALQDNMQLKISSSDKDFKVVFGYMVELSCYMMLRIYREEARAPMMTGHYPKPGTVDFENLLDDFMEDFLDTIFGQQSNLSREDFLMNVQDRTKWIFESEDIRERWDKLCCPLQNRSPGQGPKPLTIETENLNA